MDGQLPALVGYGGYLDLVERGWRRETEGGGRIEREEEGLYTSHRKCVCSCTLLLPEVELLLIEEEGLAWTTTS